MNRIETKIIIMVTNRLAAAKDSDAKTEMIEELSENLYQRYLELTQQGMPEDTALTKTMESLGDVEELLAFLRDTEADPQENRCGENTSEGIKKEQSDSAQDESHRENWTSEFKKDLGSGIDAFVNIAQATAKVAHTTVKATADCARDVAKEVSEQWKERYPDGVFSQYEVPKGEKVDCTAVQVTDTLHSLDVRLMNGDLTLRLGNTEDTLLKVEGDTQEVETFLREDGVLSIVQENTASASFFFLRGMRRCDIVVTVPQKMWNQIKISTTNGDVQVEAGLECRELHLSTASGDLQIGNLLCDQVTCYSGSGDLDLENLTGNLYATTKSGDASVQGHLGRCELRSTSGDVEFRGESQEIRCSSTSGDVEIDLENIPPSVNLISTSGDCEVRIPWSDNMRINYRTVSGDFSTNLPLTASMTKRRGEMTLGDGLGSQIQISSTSGDIEIYVK